MPLRPLPFIVDARQHPFRGPLRWDGCGGLACPCGDLQGLQFNCPYAELARIAEVLHQKKNKPPRNLPLKKLQEQLCRELLEWHATSKTRRKIIKNLSLQYGGLNENTEGFLQSFEEDLLRRQALFDEKKSIAQLTSTETHGPTLEQVNAMTKFVYQADSPSKLTVANSAMNKSVQIQIPNSLTPSHPSQPLPPPQPQRGHNESTIQFQPLPSPPYRISQTVLLPPSPHGSQSSQYVPSVQSPKSFQPPPPPLPPPPPALPFKPPPPPPPPPSHPLQSPQSPQQLSRTQLLSPPKPSLSLSPTFSSTPLHSEALQNSAEITKHSDYPESTKTQRTRNKQAALQHSINNNSNNSKPFKLVGRKHLRQWRELQQLRKWYHLQQLQEQTPNLPAQPTSLLQEIDKQMYLHIQQYLKQPSSRLLQEKIWQQMEQLKQVLMQTRVDNPGNSTEIPVLSAAWFWTMMVSLEQRVGHHSDEIEGGLKQIQKDITAVQQTSKEAAVSSPPKNNTDIARDVENMLQKVKDLELKYRILDDRIKSGNIKGAESDKQYLPFEELKALILEKQKIIFSDVSTKSEIEEANIQLEKLMVEYEKCPEVVAEKEAKRAQEEKLNLMALNKLRPSLDELTSEQREQLVKEKKVLKLMFMTKDSITKMHQNDFASLVFHKLTLEELRALRAWLPRFRKEQPSQAGWVDSLDARIEIMTKQESLPSSPPPPPTIRRKILTSPPVKSPASSGPVDMFAELLAKTKKKNEALEG